MPRGYFIKFHTNRFQQNTCYFVVTTGSDSNQASGIEENSGKRALKLEEQRKKDKKNHLILKSTN